MSKYFKPTLRSTFFVYRESDAPSKDFEIKSILEQGKYRDNPLSLKRPGKARTGQIVRLMPPNCYSVYPLIVTFPIIVTLF